MQAADRSLSHLVLAKSRQSPPRHMQRSPARGRLGGQASSPPKPHSLQPSSAPHSPIHSRNAHSHDGLSPGSGSPTHSLQSAAMPASVAVSEQQHVARQPAPSSLEQQMHGTSDHHTSSPGEQVKAAASTSEAGVAWTQAGAQSLDVTGGVHPEGEPTGLSKEPASALLSASGTPGGQKWVVRGDALVAPTPQQLGALRKHLKVCSNDHKN